VIGSSLDNPSKEDATATVICLRKFLGSMNALPLLRLLLEVLEAHSNTAADKSEIDELTTEIYEKQKNKKK